jgi:hypothetical protein
MHHPSRENGVHMLVGLPLRHRAAVAVGLYVIAVVVGAWASTLVGDPTPTIWGVALGGFTGLALALKVLLAQASLSRGRGGSPAPR